MKQILFLIFVIFQFLTIAQTTISGSVTDETGEPIFGANIYLKETYDGGSTDENGKFSFNTSETGEQTLVVSYIAFDTYSKTADVTTLNNIYIKLLEDVNSLDAVIINAGTFEAGENAKVTALKPLDVVTTASALGDFVGALQALPGTSTVAEDGRLFVRGGDADETQIFIDGIRVFSPYSTTARNIPTRGRFSPFLFKGITFSTGGYSAEYGQALSSVLLLNTNDKPNEEKTDLSFKTVGLDIGNTQIWNRNSLSTNVSYTNLAPYLAIFSDRNTWNRPLQSLAGEMVYRYQFKDDSLLKLYGAFSHSDFDLIQDDINFTNGFHYGLKNRNLYFNGSYKNEFLNDWSLSGGFSYNNDYTNTDVIDDNIDSDENSAHFKLKLKKRFNNRFKLNFGAEYLTTNFKEKFTEVSADEFKYGYDNNIVGTFTEIDLFFSKSLATKIGVRGEYSEVLNEFNFSPRVSLAYKTGKNAQLSLAYGQFFQNPNKNYLKFNTSFTAENTSHFIANYQFVKNKQIFKIEAYYKDYNNLVKFEGKMPLPNANFSNNGSAYAKGIDFFWRDNNNIKNFEYWASYSYLDTQRDYKNYIKKSRPNFATKHNISVVGKYWIKDWKSQIGLSYTFASGRSYTNPNEAGFLNSQTKNYNSASVNWAYLISKQKILYFSVNNILGTKNINGYQYKNQPNLNGSFDRRAITPAADRFFFVGFFWTISDNKNSNQLKNL